METADRPLSRRLRQMMAIDPEAVALRFADHAYRWAYHLEAIEDLELLLARAGTPTARRIGVVLRNRPAHVAAVLATLATGRQLVTLSPFHGDVGLTEDVRTLRPQVVIADPEDWARPGLATAASDIRAVPVTLGDERALTPYRDVTWTPDPGPVPADEVAVLMLTSGTTGRPKRVELTYERLTAAFDAAGTGAAMDGEPALRPETHILWSPLVHIGGLYFAISSVLEGRPTALLERFDVDRWVALVREHRPKLVGLPPTAMRMVLAADVPRDAFEGVRAVLSGTAPLDPADAEAFEDRYTIPVLTNYGATEFAGAIAGWNLRDRREWGTGKAGSVGRAHRGVELRVVDRETGATCPPGEIGILEARGGQIPAEPGAWVRTTDLASLDADGFLYIHGRADDAINRGGFKIVPAVIEDTLRAHPSVLDAAVVGRPDARLGSVPVAAVTVQPGSAAPAEADLRAWVSDRLARYHVPVAFKIVGELPRTPSLKVSRPDVLALFEEGDAA